MYSQIIIESQTQTENISCEYCMVNKTCMLRKTAEKNRQTLQLYAKAEQSMLQTILLVGLLETN